MTPTTAQSKSNLILVVDDDKFTRIQLRRAMEQEGYQVAEAVDGEECIDAYKRLQPDMVLLDALMPVVDGFDCCTQLRALTGASQVPILMITSLDDQESVDRAFEVGATDYITKPIHWAVLRQRVRRLLQASQALAELQRQNLRSQLFAEIAFKIRRSLELEDILRTTVTEVQKILQVERVLIYRLWPDGSGSGVTEAVVPGWPTILGYNFPEEVFPNEYQRLYQHGRVRVIDNVETANLTPCLVEFIHQFGVKAKLVVPLLLKEELWGLLIAHQCRGPRHWQTFEVELLQQLADQVGIALTQSQLLEQEVHQRRELARSNAELQQFAYVASHDLQEPLRKIQAFGNRLKEKYDDTLTDQGRDYLERMQNAAQRMQTLINDLLTFSRLTTQTREFVPVDLNQVVQEVIADLEVRIQQTQAQIQVADLPTLEADPVQMRQLFQNLLSNALKFHQEHQPPLIHVSSQLPEGLHQNPAEGPGIAQFCKVLVTDNGIGFDEKYLDRIFNVFQRLHGRCEYEGTGIGLAICRRIAERHGGSITAQSNLGQGATFVVTLPIKSL